MIASLRNSALVVVPQREPSRGETISPNTFT